jgi:hypothetical protein
MYILSYAVIIPIEIYYDPLGINFYLKTNRYEPAYFVLHLEINTIAQWKISHINYVASSRYEFRNY